MKQILLLTLWLMSSPSYGSGSPSAFSPVSSDKLNRCGILVGNQLVMPGQLIKWFESLNPKNPKAYAEGYFIAKALVDNVEKLSVVGLEWLATNHENIAHALNKGLTDHLHAKFYSSPPMTLEMNNAVFLASYIVILSAASFAAKEAALVLAKDAKKSVHWSPDWNEDWSIVSGAVLKAANESRALRNAWSAAWHETYQDACDGVWEVIATKYLVLKERIPLRTAHRSQILSKVTNLIALSWCSSERAAELMRLAYELSLPLAPNNGTLIPTIQDDLTAHRRTVRSPYILAVYRWSKTTDPRRILPEQVLETIHQYLPRGDILKLTSVDKRASAAPERLLQFGLPVGIRGTPVMPHQLVIAEDYTKLINALLQDLTQQIKPEFESRPKTPKHMGAAFLAYFLVNPGISEDWAAAGFAARKVAKHADLAEAWAAADHVTKDAARDAAWGAARAKRDSIAPKLAENPERDELLAKVTHLETLSWWASPEARKLRAAAYEAALAHVPDTVDVTQIILRHTSHLASAGNPYILALYRVLGIAVPAAP